MSSYNAISEKDSVESNDEQSAVVDESPELRPTVALRSQAKIDSEAIAKVDGTGERDHPNGMTLEAEEKWEAREAEKRRTRERRRTQSTVREQGSRVSVARGREQARRAFDERAASVDPWLHPGREDPREELEREELAAVNQQAARLERELRSGPTRCALARRLGERVARGDSVIGASLGVQETVQAEPGVVQPVASIDPWDYEATIQGTVRALFEPAAPSQQQVGIVEGDDAGDTVKVTIWRRSHQGTVLREGDRVRIVGGKPDRYNGQVTLAVTHDTILRVLERGDGTAPVHHTCKASVWTGASDRRGEQRHGQGGDPQDGTPVGRPREARFQGDAAWVFPASVCPNWWVESESARVIESNDTGDGSTAAGD